jgi:hypothetical protein
MFKMFTHTLGATLVGLMVGSAHAESMASSAVSAGSQVVGSLSESLAGSSNSSSADKKVAEGQYRVEQMAAVTDKPDLLRLHLQSTTTAGAPGAVVLDLPRLAVEGQGLAVQALIALRQRPYGMEVAHQTSAAAAPTAFFLLLAEGWRNELLTRAVTL